MKVVYDMSIKQKEQIQGYLWDKANKSPTLIEPHEIEMSEIEIEEFAEILMEEKKKSKEIDYNKINYCVSDLEEDKMFENLSVIKNDTLQMRILKQRPMVDRQKVEIGLHYIDKFYKGFPIEFQEFVVRQQLQIPYTEEEIIERKNEFEEQIKKEEKEEKKYKKLHEDEIIKSKIIKRKNPCTLIFD